MITYVCFFSSDLFDRITNVYRLLCYILAERLFHGYEKVLLEIMSWNPAIAAGNYICIKENPLQPHISLYIKSMHAWNGSLKYCERRKFTKYHFDLSNNVLNYYKDNKVSCVCHNDHI